MPYDADKVEKVDNLSRYVNDDDLVQIRYNDLPHTADLVEKVDNLSRYVNDDDI